MLLRLGKLSTLAMPSSPARLATFSGLPTLAGQTTLAVVPTLAGLRTIAGLTTVARLLILGTLLRYLVSVPELDYARLLGYSGSLGHPG